MTKEPYVAMRVMRNAYARIYRCKLIGSVTKNYTETVYKILDYTKNLDLTNYFQMIW